MASNVSPERSLAGSAVVSLLIAAVATRLPQLSFGSFVTMALVLIGSNIVVYLLMKLGLFKDSHSG